LHPNAAPVTDTTTEIPNATHYAGLRQADPDTFAALYTEYRKPVTQAIAAAGGSSADGSTFFRVALIHAASLAQEQKLDESIPVFSLLKSLAEAHFRDWAAEKNVTLAPVPDAETAPDTQYELPDATARLEFRQIIRAKRQFTRLEPDCQKIVQEMAKDAAINITDPRLQNGKTETCREKYRKNLGIAAEDWPDPLPTWAITALCNEHLQQSWAAAETIESRLAMGLPAIPRKQSKVTRYVLIALALAMLGFGIWSYLNPSISPKKVYDENFNPPASIMADRNARFAKDTLPVARIELCEQLFEEADGHYKNAEYEKAAEVLYTMTSGETEACKSDAYFYLAIIALQLNQPGITVECLAKMPDLERFGEEVYWYQALAFVKLAAQNPMRKDVARRAVERARSNTEIPERRVQAEKMLEQLKD
jgi:hypothetical protein